nr:tetratricopeptide repeat protein [uncultured Desulfobulbus sp.]
MRFVGREKELGILKNAWEQAKQGGVQTVALIGESRLGKTRIVQEFYSWLNREEDPSNYWPDTLKAENDSLHVNPVYDDQYTLSENCSMPWLWWGIRWTKPEQRNTAQVSLCAVLADATRLDPHLGKIRNHFAYKQTQKKGGINAAKTLANLASGGLLDPVISIWERIEDWQKIRKARSEQMSPMKQMDRRQESQLTELQSLLIGLTSPNTCFAKGLPLILILDDVQWADPESLKFIQRLIHHYMQPDRAKSKHQPCVLVIATSWEKEWNEGSETPLPESAFSAPQTFSEVVRTLNKQTADDQKPGLAFTECRLQKISESLESVVLEDFPGLSPAQAQLIVERAGGSPGLLTELLIKLRGSRFLFEKGDHTLALTKSGEAKIRTMSVKYHDLVEERLNDIPYEESNILRIASYLGMNYSRPFARQLAAATLELLQESLSDTELQTILEHADKPLAIVQPVSQQIDEFRLPIYQEILSKQLADHEDLRESILQVGVTVISSWITAERLATFSPEEKVIFLNFANRELSARLERDNDQQVQLPLLKVASAQLVDVWVSGRVLPMAPLLSQWMENWRKCGESSLIDLSLQEINAVLGCANSLEKHDEIQEISRACIKLSESQPDDEHLSCMLVIGLRRLGESLQAHDNIQQAQSYFERCLKIAECNIGLFGETAERLRDIYVSQYSVGDILLKQDQVDQAQALFEDCLKTSQRILNEFGETAERLRDIYVSQYSVGDILLKQDQVDQAQVLFEDCLKTSQRILNEFGETAERLRDISVSQNKVGDILLMQDQVDQAQALFEDSLKTRQRILNEFGETAERLRDISISQDKVGDILLKQDQVDQAQALFEDSLKTRQRILNEFGETAERLRDISISQDKVGDILLMQDQVDQAQALFEDSLKTRQRILNEFGETAERLRDISISQDKVGDILLMQDQVDQAQALFEDSLETRQRILNEFGETAERLRDISVSQNKVGDILLMQDQVDQAQALFEDSLKTSNGSSTNLAKPLKGSEIYLSRKIK